MDYRKIKNVQIMVYARTKNNFWLVTKDIAPASGYEKPVSDMTWDEFVGYHQNHVEVSENHLYYAQDFISDVSVKLETDIRYSSGKELNGHLTSPSNIVDVNENPDGQLRTSLYDCWLKSFGKKQ